MWNRIAALMVIITAMSLFIAPMEVEARRGGGGGRGGGGRGGGGRVGGGGGARRGGGGAYRGGRTMNRTPTMSRASRRPAASQPRQRPQTRPAQRPQTRPAQRPQTRPGVSQGRGQSRQRVQQRPSAANRTELRNQVGRYAQNRPAQRPSIDRQPLTQRNQDFSRNRNNQILQNRQLSDNVSQRLRNSRSDFNHWFDRDFFDRHDIDVGYVGIGANWWRPAAWATLANWGAWNWSTPYYYDDGGYSYPITTTESTYAYPSTTTTTTSQPMVTQPVQTQPQQNVQTTAATTEEWLPLGVFAVANDANAAAQTNRFMQLAINRSGEIAGVLYNYITDDAQDLTGMVDANTQKAYWSLDDQMDSPIASTGIYNLTEDQTPINVHFADGTDQTWVLVRLKQE